jgi:UDP-N-acetylmuramoyl-tripeptide--D-alanyl-D-alanine ligase
VSTPLPENAATFSLEDVLRATGAEIARGGLLSTFRGVVTDTRAVVRGKLFVALRGERFDAHSFIARAAAGGAAGVVMDRREPPELPPEVTVFQVPDPEQALLELGAAHRARFLGPVVGVAGSAGKTTTRSLVTSVLEALRPGRVHSTRGNLNSRIGVALSLLALPLDSEVMVLEIGTNAPGEIRNLTEAVRPELGVLTLIDLEHTEGLIDLDGVEAEEAALFDFLLRTSGRALGNGDDARIVEQLKRFPLARAQSYGFSPRADVRIVERTVASDLSSRFAFEGAFGILRGTTSLLNRARALAGAAAAAVAEALFPGELTAPILAGAFRGRPEPGRGQLLQDGQGAVWIDESYNSNPGSARACIDAAFELSRELSRELTLVLGEMRELGAESARQHQLLGEYVAKARPARAVFVGGDAELAFRVALKNGVQADYFASSEVARRELSRAPGPRDLVLLKGSRGVRLEALLPLEASPIPPDPDSAKGARPLAGPSP